MIEKICETCGRKYYVCDINVSGFISVPKNPEGCCVHTQGPFTIKKIENDCG